MQSCFRRQISSSLLNFVVLIGCVLMFFATAGRAEDTKAGFALKDGDTLVFLGDSITASRGYTKIVELYTLMRYPERRVKFWNAGQGGDTAAGAVARLERDVFAHGATVVTVAFGVGQAASTVRKGRNMSGVLPR